MVLHMFTNNMKKKQANTKTWACKRGLCSSDIAVSVTATTSNPLLPFLKTKLPFSGAAPACPLAAEVDRESFWCTQRVFSLHHRFSAQSAFQSAIGGPTLIWRRWSRVSSFKQVRWLCLITFSCENILSRCPLAIGWQKSYLTTKSTLDQFFEPTALKSFYQIPL